MHKDDALTAMNQAAMTPAKGVAVLAAVAVGVAGYLVLSHALGIVEAWAGFLFLLYWAGIERMSIEKLPPCVVGALLGVVIATLPGLLPDWLGESKMRVFLGVIVVLVYCQIMGWLPTAINMMTMLYLTVGTIPWIQAKVDFAGMLSGALLGIGYFGGLLGGSLWLAQRRATRVPATTE